MRDTSPTRSPFDAEQGFNTALGEVQHECLGEPSSEGVGYLLGAMLIVGGGVLGWFVGRRAVAAGGELPLFAADVECWAGLALAGGTAAALIVGGGTLVWGELKKSSRRLYLCENGLCAVRGQVHEAFLWDDVEAVVQLHIDAPVRVLKHAPDAIMPRVKGSVLSLRRCDGKELSIGDREFPADHYQVLHHAIQVETKKRNIPWTVRPL